MTGRRRGHMRRHIHRRRNRRRSARRSPRSRRPIASHPPQPGPPADAAAAGDSEAEAVERPARVDRRAARGAGRAGQPRVVQRHGERSAGQVRPRELHRRDARGGRRPRARRSRLPTRSITSAPISARPRARTSSSVRLHVPVARLADALPIMADVALRPTFPRDELERQRQQRLTEHPAVARRSADDRRARVLARPVRQGPPLRHGADGHRGNDQGVHRRRSPQRSTRRCSGPTTRRCSRSATSRPTR